MRIPRGLLRQRLIVSSAGEQKTLSLARHSKTATMLGNASDRSRKTAIPKYHLHMAVALLERLSHQSAVLQMQIQRLPLVHLLPVTVSSTSIRCPAFPQIRLAEEQTDCLWWDTPHVNNRLPLEKITVKYRPILLQRS